MSLSELQADALAELFNVAVGSAGATLSEMVEEPLGMTAPRTLLVPLDDALGEFAALAGDNVLAVSQTFEGSFRSEAFLMFPEAQSLELVRAVLMPHLALDEVGENAQEALGEVGNIILNTCIGTIANIFEQEFVSSVPRLRIGSLRQILGGDGEAETDMVLVVRIEFHLQSRDILGHLAFLLDMPSIEELKRTLDRYLGQFGDA